MNCLYARMRIAGVGLALLAIGPREGHGQGIPLVSVELAAGSGAHTAQTPHVYYVDERTEFQRFGVTARLGPPGMIRPILVAEHSPRCGFWVDYCEQRPVVCLIAPNGQCRQWFSNPAGNAVALGMGGAWKDRVIGALTGGIAQYARSSRYIDANLSLRLLPHVAFVADARRISSTDDRGDRTWFSPFSMGLRLYY